MVATQHIATQCRPALGSGGRSSPTWADRSTLGRGMRTFIAQVGERLQARSTTTPSTLPPSQRSSAGDSRRIPPTRRRALPIIQAEALSPPVSIGPRPTSGTFGWVAHLGQGAYSGQSPSVRAKPTPQPPHNHHRPTHEQSGPRRIRRTHVPPRTPTKRHQHGSLPPDDPQRNRPVSAAKARPGGFVGCLTLKLVRVRRPILLHNRTPWMVLIVKLAGGQLLRPFVYRTFPTN